MEQSVVVGEDGVARCPWAARPGLDRDYHDTEWGLPITGERAYLERVTLEAFQSGLSWSTILAKRDNFRAAFDGFEPEVVAAYDEAKVAALMADAGIVRNRRKIDAAVTNARAVVALTDTTLERLVRDHAPAPRPAPTTLADVPATAPESVALAKELKRRGFVFVGPTTLYALMQATGLVDDHLAGCHRRGVAG